MDEADRILDMGFSETLNAILQNLPINRQTLLFSATQTKSIRDLARLSLKVFNFFTKNLYYSYRILNIFLSMKNQNLQHLQN